MPAASRTRSETSIDPSASRDRCQPDAGPGQPRVRGPTRPSSDGAARPGAVVVGALDVLGVPGAFRVFVVMDPVRHRGDRVDGTRSVAPVLAHEGGCGRGPTPEPDGEDDEEHRHDDTGNVPATSPVGFVHKCRQ